ncbi:hypothetical protein BRC81_14080 [Halobacteriales archaeon QS_1_68_20]|nr:MAG: hypothetical protein BRC81_14080 [Halobacteriales archaeon QS_1_68_20]
MASILVATVLMGLLTLAVVLYVARAMEWRKYDFVPVGEHRSTWDSLGAALHHPAAWALGFFLLVFLTVGTALAAVDAISFPVDVGLGMLAMPFALMLVLFVGLGTYGALRSRRRSTAEATVVSLLLLGTLFIVAITANLVLG